MVEHVLHVGRGALFGLLDVEQRAGLLHRQHHAERVQDVPAHVDIVDVFRRPEFVPELVAEAIEAGAKAVWTQLQIVNEEAAATATGAAPATAEAPPAEREAVLAIPSLRTLLAAQPPDSKTSAEKSTPTERWIVPFDFESKFDDGRYGQMVGDMIWKKLERQGGVVAIEGDQPCGADGFRTFSWDAARLHARVEAEVGDLEPEEPGLLLAERGPQLDAAVIEKARQSAPMTERIVDRLGQRRDLR